MQLDADDVQDQLRARETAYQEDQKLLLSTQTKANEVKTNLNQTQVRFLSYLPA